MLRQTKTLKKFLTIQSGFLSLFTTNSQHLIPKFHALTKTNYTNPNPIYRTNENIINNPPNIPNLPDNISSDNIEKNNTNPNFPNNDKNKNNSNDNDNEASMQVNLETFILEAQKFPLTPEEQSLPTRTYAFFSSGQSALAKNNTNVTFDIGSLTAGNLDYDIAFFMQAGDSGAIINKIIKINELI